MEREFTPEPYWRDDVLLGEVVLPEGSALVRLRLHQDTEAIPDGSPLVPLTHPDGSRVYVHAQPYILEPDIALTVDLRPDPGPAGRICAVVASTWDGLRHVAIGQAQAWFYPADRVLVLWECYLRDSYRQDDPVHDPALAMLWQGFEAELRHRFPAATRVATPAWEDLYPRPAWQAFLAQQGYSPETAALFSKPATGQPG